MSITRRYKLIVSNIATYGLGSLGNSPIEYNMLDGFTVSINNTIRTYSPILLLELQSMSAIEYNTRLNDFLIYVGIQDISLRNSIITSSISPDINCVTCGLNPEFLITNNLDGFVVTNTGVANGLLQFKAYPITGNYNDYGWQQSNIFTGLLPNTEYFIFIRDVVGQNVVCEYNKTFNIESNVSTTEPVSGGLKITFDSIDNVPVSISDASSVSDWNAFFDLPANGVEFTSVEVPSNDELLRYGTLYNNIGAENIPNGDFEIPSVGSWNTLITYIDDIYCSSLMATGVEYWDESIVNATNLLNFNLRGNGVRDATDGLFYSLKYVAFLMAQGGNTNVALDPIYGFNTTYVASTVGSAIRLVRAATTAELLFTDGTYCDNYIGNDGKIYRTVKIGTQVWMVDNLDETLYVDLSPIPIVSDTTTWISLSTGARCFYDNTILNAHNTCLVELFGGSGITIKEELFYFEFTYDWSNPEAPITTDNNHLLTVFDNCGSIVTIGKRAFAESTTLTDVYFPNCIECLNDYIYGFEHGAFYYNHMLVSANLPKLVDVGRYTFESCSALTTLEIDYSEIISLPDGAFIGCESITLFSFPNLIATGIVTFSNCILASFDMPKLNAVGNSCFYGCIGEDNFNFPLVETIGHSSFAYTTCDSFYFPLVTDIQVSTFFGCLATSFDLPSVINTYGEPTNIPTGPFQSCVNMIEINLPVCETIGRGGFSTCGDIETINLPKVTSIGDRGFTYCTSLTTLSIPKCTSLGTTTGLNWVFLGITGKTITLTIPSALMTCNGGNPDGDIQYLAANNTVTIVTV